MTTRTIKVDTLARVEGEGWLSVRIKGDRIDDLKFGIHEPPRFFEALLRGRMFWDAPDITARICGICPIAYMLGASQAMEDALGVTVPSVLRDLRRLIYCAEWIQSHTLHVYMLHAPDFLGLADSIELARRQPGVVEAGLQLKKLGNEIMAVVGGRSIHPVNLKVGGFYKAPDRAAIRGLAEPLKRGLETALTTVRMVAGFDFPDLERDYTFVALRHPVEYAILDGRLVSNRGLDIPVSAFHDHVQEEHVAHSNALHGVMKDGTVYLVGPLARYAINRDRLGETARQAADAAGLGPVVRNPFKSIVVRAVEVVQVIADALAIVEGYDPPAVPAVAIEPRAGTGHGCTEAPRGICHHRYTLNADGTIARADIVPPTSQNQKSIEADLYQLVSDNLTLADEQLKWRAEQAIRNYDPCISCATHFLKLDVTRA